MTGGGDEFVEIDEPEEPSVKTTVKKSKKAAAEQGQANEAGEA